MDEDDSVELEELTKSEEYLLGSVLPAVPEDIGEELGVSASAASAHMESMKDSGMPVGFDESSRMWYVTDAAIKRKVGSKHMGTITKRANDWLAQTESTQRRQARNVDPVAKMQEPESGNQDIVAVFSDAHVGQSVENEHGNIVYGEKEWREAFRHFTEKCLEIPPQFGSHTDFDTFHLLLNGDLVTNENIYNHQIEDIGAYIADQIDITVEELVKMVFTFAENFDTINVVCQVGNHGEMRASGSTRQANADLILYRELKRVLHHSEYDNVNFQVGDATAFKTFSMRGGEWHGFATHGEDAYEQITGTSASDSQMQNWLIGVDPRPDIFYLSHYHELRRVPVKGIPAVRSPSPKPGGIYEWQIGQLQHRDAQNKIGFIHGVSDDRVQTWEAGIDTVDSDILP
jgi:hypothetical protein